MPVVWCSISGHGYGHAAQVVPVLNELGKLVPRLRAILRTTVPEHFFHTRLDLDWELSVEEQDIGCAQEGPLHINVEETWAAHERFHADWEARVRREEQAIRAAAPQIVLSDIAYLASEAAHRAQVPTVALSNLSWDLVLEPFHDRSRTMQGAVLQQMVAAYHKADLMLRIEPGLPMRAFPRVKEIGPIRQVTQSQPETLRAAINAKPDETVVLVGFGGVPLYSVPFDAMERMVGFRFIVPGRVSPALRSVHSSDAIPLGFPAILASVDVVMTKPGYSTIVEAVAHRKPVVYVRRYNFADESLLVDYLHRYGRGVQLAEDDFTAGRWRPGLEAALDTPMPNDVKLAANGAADAADILASYF